MFMFFHMHAVILIRFICQTLIIIKSKSPQNKQGTFCSWLSVQICPALRARDLQGLNDFCPFLRTRLSLDEGREPPPFSFSGLNLADMMWAATKGQKCVLSQIIWIIMCFLFIDFFVVVVVFVWFGLFCVN